MSFFRKSLCFVVVVFVAMFMAERTAQAQGAVVNWTPTVNGAVGLFFDDGDDLLSEGTVTVTNWGLSTLDAELTIIENGMAGPTLKLASLTPGQQMTFDIKWSQDGATLDEYKVTAKIQLVDNIGSYGAPGYVVGTYLSNHHYKQIVPVDDIFGF